MVKSKVRETPEDYVVRAPLPALLPVREVQQRLEQIFPESFPDRRILVGDMAACVVFVFLYGGFIEGQERFLRPSHVYLFTEKQSKLTSDIERASWIFESNRPGHRPAGVRWYADTSRESIRDDLMRNQLLRLGIMQKQSGAETTSSTPINYLTAGFAALFDPALADAVLDEAITRWRQTHLDSATLQRMALRAQGIHAKTGDVYIDMPDGARLRVSGGKSALIAKALIEVFAPRHLMSPSVLWLSASDKKSYPQFVELAASVGLSLDLSAELPDLILADTGDPIRFYFCEIVATDGAVTEERKKALLALVRSSHIPEHTAHFVTAFEDREAAPFRKNFSQLALDSWVWFRTEPELLVVLTTDNRTTIDPNR